MKLVRDLYRHSEALRRLQRQLAAMPNARMLDVGCRHGDVTRELARDKAWSVALDRVAFPDWREPAPRLEFIRGDAGALPFRDGSFDLVVSGECLQYVPDWTAALDEMHRVLAPGGALVLNCPGGNAAIEALEPYNLTIRTGALLDRLVKSPRLRRRLRPRSVPNRRFTRYLPPARVTGQRHEDWSCELVERRATLAYIYAAFLVDNLQQLRLDWLRGSRLQRWLARTALAGAIRLLFGFMRWDFALRLGPLSYNTIYRFRKAGPGETP